jgi:hypothetical protein
VDLVDLVDLIGPMCSFWQPFFVQRLIISNCGNCETCVWVPSGPCRFPWPNGSVAPGGAKFLNSASSLSAMWCVQCRDNRRCLVHRAKAIRALSQKMQVFAHKNQHEQMHTNAPVNTKDGRSRIVFLLYWQIGQGRMANFLAFIALKYFHLWNYLYSNEMT